MKGIKELMEESNGLYYSSVGSYDDFKELVEELLKKRNEKYINNNKQCSSDKS